MGGGAGTVMMGVNDALEEKAVNVNINGKKTKVSAIEGVVRGVTGFNNGLDVFLDPEKTTYRISLIMFDGVSPVRMGDRIRAGLIVTPEFGKKAVYLGLMKDASSNSAYERIDFMNGYDPLHVDWKKFGLP